MIKNAAYILLDGSSSMVPIWEESLTSINTYVSKLPGDTWIYLATFINSEYRTLRVSTAAAWEALSSKEVSPYGNTPLNDSVMRILHRVKDDRPDKAVMVFVTDGEENSSRHYKIADVRREMKTIIEKGYEPVFLGANFDKIEDQAKGYGLDNFRERGVWMNGARGMGMAINNLSAKTSSYYDATNASEGAAVMNFNEQEKADSAEK